MNGPTRKKVYDYLVARDGEYCKCCGALSTERQLVIDHKDNDNSNNFSKNLQLLCRGCNYIKNPRPVDLSECVEITEDITELETNKLKEPLFRKFVFHEINELNEVPEIELINSGAEDIGISPVTAKRYLNKMCSSRGLLQRIRRVQTMVIRYK